MRLSVSMGVFALALTACGGSVNQASLLVESPSAEDIAYVRAPISMLTPEFVRETGFNRDHLRHPEFALGYIERRILDTLPLDIQARLVEVDARTVAEQTFDWHSLTPLNAVEPDLQGDFEDYHNYDALTAELQRIAIAHPEIVQLESAGRSVQGRELWLLKISDHASLDEDEPKLLYIANMHGDEVVGRELMIYLARLLTSSYGSDPRITQLVANAQIFIMPSMNPDGFELKRRYTARGIDLNRDFPDFTSDPYDTTPGRAVETQAVMSLHAKHQFVLSLNFHGGEVCFNMPWDTQPNATRRERFDDAPLMLALGRQYADLNPTMHGNSGGSFDHGLTYGYEWYEIDGGMQDWSIHYRESTHATVELSMTKWPRANKLPGFWEENRESILQYLERGIYGVHLRVVDERDQPIDEPRVRVASTDRTVRYARNTLTRPTLTEQQTVTVSATGYESQQLSLMPQAFRGEFVTVRLAKASPTP